jgi:hypothetical protein
MKIKYKLKELHRPAGEPDKAQHGLHNITGAGLEEMLEISEELYEKKDRCYNLAKQKYDVFPSAYASGFIVRCRKGKVAKKKK